MLCYWALFTVYQPSITEDTLEKANAAASISNIYENMPNTLAGFQETSKASRTTVRYTAKDERLCRRAEEVYTVVLDSIEGMVD